MSRKDWHLREGGLVRKFQGSWKGYVFSKSRETESSVDFKTDCFLRESGGLVIQIVQTTLTLSLFYDVWVSAWKTNDES